MGHGRRRNSRRNAPLATWAGLIMALAAGDAMAAVPDAADPTAWVTNGPVNAIARVGSTTFLGGDFHTIGPRTGQAVMLSRATGAVDSSFPEVAGAPGGGGVGVVLADGSGGWYLGGRFAYVAGVARKNLAHVRADGTVDPAFAPAPGDTVEALELSQDGTVLYLGGRFQTVGGATRHWLASVSASSGAVTAWDPNPNQAVHDIVRRPGTDTLYVGGDFSGFGSPVTTRNRLAALSPSSNTPLAWNPGANGGVVDLLFTADGSALYAGGWFSMIGGGGTGTAARNRLARLDPAVATGAPAAWNPGADSTVYALALAAGESTLYAGGGFAQLGGATRHGLGAVSTSGAGTATAWNPDITDSETLSGSAPASVRALLLDGSTVYAGGNFGKAGTATRLGIAAIDAATGAPTAWNPAAGDVVLALAVAGDRILAGGRFNAMGAVVRTRLAAAGPDGVATSWDPGSDGEVRALAPSPDGQTLYVGGNFGQIGGQTRNNLAALSIASGTASGWAPDPSSDVLALAVASGDGTVYAGGAFGTIGGGTRNYLAALDPVTGLAGGWNPDPDGRVNALVLDAAGGRMFVGGAFTAFQAGAVTRRYLAAVPLAGVGSPTTWDPSGTSGATTFSLALAPDRQTLYVGGDFSGGDTVGGQVRRYLAAVSTTTGNATAFAPEPDDGPRALLVAADGQTVYAGGAFTAIGGTARAYLAALDPATGSVTAWAANGADSDVRALAEHGGTLLVGGDFKGMGARASAGFAQFTAPPVSTAAPAISGVPEVGRPLVCSPGTWDNEPYAFTYAWRRDGAAIAGATAATHVVAAADAGGRLTCTVTATNAGGSAAATSAAVAVPGTGTPGADTVAPIVAGLAFSPRTFRVGSGPTAVVAAGTRAKAPKGTTIRYSLSEAATVRIALRRLLPGLRLARGSCVRRTPARLRALRRTLARSDAVRKLHGKARARLIARLLRQRRCTVSRSAARPITGVRDGGRCRAASRERLARLRRALARRKDVQALSGRARDRAVERLLRKRRCRRGQTAGALTRASAAGANAVRFSGRVGPHALPPGRYRALVTATDVAGNRSARRATTFRIVR